MNCSDCLFYEPVRDSEYGNCRRYPPVIAQWDHPTAGRQFESRKPIVSLNDWCGEYKSITRRNEEDES